MSLLPNKKYTRPKESLEVTQSTGTDALLNTLVGEANLITDMLIQIEDAKAQEATLREKLGVITRAYEDLLKVSNPQTKQEETEEASTPSPAPNPPKVRKSATKKVEKPTPTPLDTTQPMHDNSEVVHSDFAVFKD